VADNAIHPTWRNASSFVITNVIMSGTESWAVKKEREKFNTNVVGKALRDVSPNGASYVNEVSLLVTRQDDKMVTDNQHRVIFTSRTGSKRTGVPIMRVC
jgi:hypothetical protein